MLKPALVLMLAWTMWIRTQTLSSDTWNPAPGFATQQKCIDSMKEKLDLWRQFKDAVFTENTVTFTGNNTMMSYYCLIESEDPRKARPSKPQK